MRISVLLVAALTTVVVAGPAVAVTRYEYVYSGHPMFGVGLGVDDQGNEVVTEQLDPLPGYNLRLVVNENTLPGRTLRNAEVLFCHTYRLEFFECGTTLQQLDGLVSVTSLGDPTFQWNPDVFDTDVGRIELYTDANRDVLHYNLRFSGNAIPGGSIGFNGDSYTIPEMCSDWIPADEESFSCVWQNSDSGTWTVAPIPVPLSLPFALAGVGALGLTALFGRGRTDSRS